MRPLRMKLQEAAVEKKVPINVIEKDYVLSYVLAGIARQKELSDSLVFKRGTALKKIHFRDYRFSEDLDFSVIDAPQGQELENYLVESLRYAKQLLNEYGPFELELKRNPERAPHPNGQEAFNAYIKFPWQRSASCRIKIEITHDEPVLMAPDYKPILHDYDEPMDCQVATYKIEEIVAEKLRALLQTHQKLVTRGWNRPRASDYYDLWSILKNHSDAIDRARVIEMLGKKSAHRNVSYTAVNDFFTLELINEANKNWDSTLGVLIQGLGSCDEILQETQGLVAELFLD